MDLGNKPKISFNTFSSEIKKDFKIPVADVELCL